MRERIGDWMQTASGRQYWPLDPRAEEVTLFDIAHALSMQCRYGGHCSHFYSVAEHSVLVSRMVPREHALTALLHDATEAYCADVPRPLKRHLSNYAEIEALNWRAIAEAFMLDEEMHPSIKDADNAILANERDALMMPTPKPWPGVAVPGVHIECWSPERASAEFRKRYLETVMA